MKIFYILDQVGFSRVFAPFKKREDVVQKIVYKKNIKTHECGLPKIPFWALEELKSLMKIKKPDVVVIPRPNINYNAIFTKYKISTVYVAHGVWSNRLYSQTSLFNESSKLNGFDIIFCATNDFVKMCQDNSILHPVFITNAIPQFDLLYEKFITAQKINERKEIMLVPHKLKIRNDLNEFHYDFYKSAVELAKFAQKENFILKIKPKSDSFDFISVLSTIDDLKFKWAQELYKQYYDLKENKNVIIIPYQSQQLLYQDLVCSDVIITTGFSTVDVETALIGKILIKVFSKLNVFNGFLGQGRVINKNAAHITMPDKIIDTVVMALNNPYKLRESQKNAINDMGILFDGRHCERIVDNILKFYSNEKK